MLLPAAAARCWGLGVAASMALATGFGMAASAGGLLVSYHGNLPSGPAIVLAAGLLFGSTRRDQRVAPPNADWEEHLMLRCLIALVALLLAGPTRAADRIMVVATFSVIGDMLANVGGDHIDIKTIVGAGGDCEAIPADCSRYRVSRIGACRVHQRPQRRVRALAGAAARTGYVQGHEAGGDPRRADADSGGGASGFWQAASAAIDQHAWLDPHNGIVYVRNVADALARLDLATPPTTAHARRPTRSRSRRSTTGRARRWQACRRVSGGCSLRTIWLQDLANAYGITLLTVNGWTNKTNPQRRSWRS